MDSPCQILAVPELVPCWTELTVLKGFVLAKGLTLVSSHLGLNPGLLGDRAGSSLPVTIWAAAVNTVISTFGFGNNHVEGDGGLSFAGVLQAEQVVRILWLAGQMWPLRLFPPYHTHLPTPDV